MRKLGYILISLAFLTNTAYAEVSQFSFTTEIQTIKPNTDSGTITVQSQDSSGTSEPIAETFDLVFTSSSPTGVFLSTSGNPVSTTMSKNTSNKNFIYKDSTEGNFTLTVNATGRTSGKSFTASQPITISTGASNTSTTTNTSTSTTTTQNTNTTNNTQTVTVYVYSSHSSPAPLSETENKISFEVSGGRDRLTSAGNELMFKASATKVQNISTQAISYKWSFGDGGVALGNIVYHAYKFPGEYVVVLNANGSDGEAVSRLNVKVIAPELSVAKVAEGIQVSNNSKYEVNLGGWIISSDKAKFTIPIDTIILSGKTIIFPNDATGISDENVNLKNPLDRIVSETKRSASGEVLGASISKPDEKKLLEIQAKIDDVKAKVNKLVSSNMQEKPRILVAPISQKSEITPSKQEATATVIYVAPESRGIISKIFSFPGTSWQYLRKVIGN